MKSWNPTICISGEHFQWRWIFCPLKNNSNKRYMSDYSLSVILFRKLLSVKIFWISVRPTSPSNKLYIIYIYSLETLEDNDFVTKVDSFFIKQNYGLSVLGQKVNQNVQIEIEFKLEFKSYKLYLVSMSVRQYHTFTWNFSACKVRAFV